MIFHRKSSLLNRSLFTDFVVLSRLQDNYQKDGMLLLHCVER